jgi:hypothetical protein
MFKKLIEALNSVTLYPLYRLIGVKATEVLGLLLSIVILIGTFTNRSKLETSDFYLLIIFSFFGIIAFAISTYFAFTTGPSQNFMIIKESDGTNRRIDL